MIQTQRYASFSLNAHLLYVYFTSMRIMIRNANIDSTLPGFDPKISLFLRIKTVILRCNFICVSQSGPPRDYDVILVESDHITETLTYAHAAHSQFAPSSKTRELKNREIPDFVTSIY
jgi:hypothetical protein